MFTSRLHGFDDAQDYYSRCSAFPFIKQIAKPCMIVHANDDPIAPSSVLPDRKSLPDSVQLEVTEHGGHAGFFGGSIIRPRYWIVERILTYLSQFA